MFRSIDEGATWQRLEGSPVDIVLIASHPDERRILYASATGNGGFFRSSDEGSTWREIFSGSFIRAILFDRSNPFTAYFGGQGISRTDDGAESWQNTGEGLPPGASVSSLAVDPNDDQIFYAGICAFFIDAEPHAGVYKSEDRGHSWFAAGTGLPSHPEVEALVIHPISGVLYGAVGEGSTNGSLSGRGVYKSEDGGLSWQPTGLTDTYLLSLEIDPTNPEILYGASVSTIERSMDGGRHGNSFSLRTPRVYHFQLIARGRSLRPVTPASIRAKILAAPGKDRGLGPR